jgi:hypothetical protein
MKRRDFLKTSITATTVAGISTASLDALAGSGPAAAAKNREYYELRAYRLKGPGNRENPLDPYLDRSLIPALNRLGCKPIGVFAQLEKPEAAEKEEVRDANTVLVLIPYPSLDVFAAATEIVNDAEFRRAGAAHLEAPKEHPAFDRIDSWLFLAFAGMPHIELPAASREKRQRFFELRTYQSHSEVKAMKKVEMFNAGEIEVMREVGLAPVFYGQALAGSGLPHLSYMLSAENPEAHGKHWGAFGKHPTWNKMKNDPQFADTVSNISKHYLVPKPYSQI